MNKIVSCITKSTIFATALIILASSIPAFAGYGYTVLEFNYPNLEAFSVTVIYQWEASRCEYSGDGWEECYRVMPAVNLFLFEPYASHPVGHNFDICECTHVQAGIIFIHPHPRGYWTAIASHWSYVEILQSGMYWINYYCPSSDQEDVTCYNFQKDLLIAEYAEYGCQWYPQCDDFIEEPGPPAGLNFGDYDWAVIDTVRAGVAGWEAEFRKQTIYTVFSISSAYRNPAANWRAGGVPNSMHLYGRAADVDVISDTAAERTVIEQALRNAYPRPTYVEVGSGNRYVHGQW